MSKIPPASITVELRERDVRDDLVRIIEDMGKIRNEHISNSQIPAEIKDEYLHLTYRLASVVKGLINENRAKEMQDIVKTVDKDRRLLRYDSRQDLYWKRRIPAFSQCLDDLVIFGMGDSFRNMEDKHHFLQALKYLAIENETNFDEKEIVLDSILPRHGGIEIHKEGIARRILSRIIGKRYRLESAQGGYTAVTNFVTFKDLESIVEIAREMGFSKLTISSDNGDAITNRFSGAKVDSEANTDYSQTGFVDGLLRVTKPLSYFIIGSLPERIQKKVNAKYEHYDGETGFYISAWFEALGGIAAGLYAGVKNDPSLGILIGAPFVAEAIIRGSYSSSKSRVIGTLAGKLLMYPFEDSLGVETLNPCLVDIPLLNQSESERCRISDYEKAALIEMPDEIEESLIWSAGNHHEYGNKFAANVNGNLNIGKGFVDKEHQAVIYNQGIPIGDYIKKSWLFCFHNERYLITGIAENNVPDSDKLTLTGRIAEELTNGDLESLGERTKRIGTEDGMKYIRLRRYSHGKITHDYEGMN